MASHHEQRPSAIHGPALTGRVTAGDFKLDLSWTELLADAPEIAGGRVDAHPVLAGAVIRGLAARGIEVDLEAEVSRQLMRQSRAPPSASPSPAFGVPVKRPPKSASP